MAMLLENMQVFTRVVELGSLSAAGRHLRLSPAVVSHRLQQLEGPGTQPSSAWLLSWVTPVSDHDPGSRRREPVRRP